MINLNLFLFWPAELLGRLHPVAVHFPIGLLAGALLLEGWARVRSQEISVAPMIYLGAVTAFLSAVMGSFLASSGSYEGETITYHQISGYTVAAFSLLTAWLYWKKPAWKHLPFVCLGITCLVLTVAGHLGAGITHGTDYLSSVFQPKEATRISSEWAAYSAQDSLPADQLDKLSMEVRTLFAHRCYQCHNEAKRKGALALDHKEGLFAGGESGPAIVPGKSAESELIRRIGLPRSHDDAMPPKGKLLSEEEIDLIAFWIDKGAHWADQTLKVFPEAPLALTKPMLPDAKGGRDHPIDRFVSQYFAQNDIQWPAVIDDRQFIRRAYLDATGLLPSLDAVQAFVKNTNPKKRQELVEQLLADKQPYALHWLSFWNDLLRNDYSGTGYITGGRKQITHWLYQSLLLEKPYDKMVTELIDPDPESEGFIKGIQWRGEVNSSQRTELQAAQNISQSLLGLNLKCASCHNSFVNNVTLEEAYNFASIFALKPLEIYRCDKPTGRVAKAAFLYPQLGQVASDSLKERLTQLANVIVQPQNGRLYRTVVNRYWDRLFGRGIIAPVDEMDNTAWNQELLDWLATTFIDQGYDLKKLLLLIMTSQTYQLPAMAYPTPEYLVSNTFVFKGPAVRRLSAEQFADAFSRVVDPLYYSVAFDPDQRKVDARWIWHPQREVDRRVLPYPGTRLFRKTFDLVPGKTLQSARLVVTADQAFELYLNGKPITQGNDWHQVQHADIPPDLLGPKNILAVKGVNDGLIPNPAGLLLQLQLHYTDNSTLMIVTDGSWKSTADTLAPQWTQFDFDDSTWLQAESQGSFQNSYWGALLQFTTHPDSSSFPFARASLAQLDDFMKTLGRPTRENVATRRDDQATLLQALMLSNAGFFHEHLHNGAKNWLKQTNKNPAKIADQLFQKAFGRLPGKQEKKLLLQQLGTNPTPEKVEDLLWALVLLPEFQFI